MEHSEPLSFPFPNLVLSCCPNSACPAVPGTRATASGPTSAAGRSWAATSAPRKRCAARRKTSCPLPASRDANPAAPEGAAPLPASAAVPVRAPRESRDSGHGGAFAQPGGNSGGYRTVGEGRMPEGLSLSSRPQGRDEIRRVWGRREANSKLWGLSKCRTHIPSCSH